MLPATPLLAMDRFYWTGMRKQIFKKYNECEECQVNSISKEKRHYEIVPADLTLLAPGEELNVDFLVFNGKSILVIVVQHSGYVFGEITKDQSTQSACKTIHSYINTFGIPHQIISNSGPSCRDNIRSLLKGYNIDHNLTSAYQLSSNGLVEQGVRSIKDVLNKGKD